LVSGSDDSDERHRGHEQDKMVDLAIAHNELPGHGGEVDEESSTGGRDDTNI